MIRAGIDIGAGSLRLVLEEEGTVFDEPCLVALDKHGNALAIGSKAFELKGRQDKDIRVVAPFSAEGVDFKALDALLEELCYEFRLFRLFQKTILMVSAPLSLTEEYSTRLKEHFLDLGAWEVYFEEELWVAAVGAGLDLCLPVGSCVMHIGYSSCDVAMFCQGEIQARAASSTLNGRSAAILLQQYLRMHDHVDVSLHTLNLLLQKAGSAQIVDHPKAFSVRGLDMSEYKAVQVTIDQNQIASFLAPMVREWGSWLQEFIDSLPEELKSDIAVRGVIACGGCMNIPGLAAAMQSMCGIPVYLTDFPAETVSFGLQRLLQDFSAESDEA